MMEDFWDPYGEPPEEAPDELEDDGLPPIHALELADIAPLRPELISGVLRESGKMLLAGPSKAGKSFAMIELALCLASGRPWLDRFE